MSDYGLIIKNVYDGIQIDSKYRNYALWASGDSSNLSIPLTTAIPLIAYKIDAGFFCFGATIEPYEFSVKKGVSAADNWSNFALGTRFILYVDGGPDSTLIFTADQNNKSLMAGVTSKDSISTYSDLNAMFYLKSDNTFDMQVTEADSSVTIQAGTTYNIGDIFKITSHSDGSYNGSTIYYFYYNDTLLFTHTTTAVANYLGFGACIYNAGGSISHIKSYDTKIDYNQSITPSLEIYFEPTSYNTVPYGNGTDWLCFTEHSTEALPEYGLVVRNSNNDIVFSSGERYLKIFVLHAISFVSNGHQDVSVIDADNNFFISLPGKTIGYVQDGLHAFSAGMEKISSIQIRCSYNGAADDAVINSDPTQFPDYNGWLLEVGI